MNGNGEKNKTENNSAYENVQVSRPKETDVHVNVHVKDIEALLEDVAPDKKKKFQEILEQIYQNKHVTIEQLSSEMGVVPKTAYRYIAEMKQKGILRREGAPKNGTWVILWKEKKTET